MGPLVGRPTYDIPKGIRKRERSSPKPEITAVVKWPDPVDSKQDQREPEPELTVDQEFKTENPSNSVDRESIRPMIDNQPPIGPMIDAIDDPKVEPDIEVGGTPEDDGVCYHEGKDLMLEYTEVLKA
ncbi:hypothetical protein DVH05_008704 [Phytophthora capsici]|nr:hypothetical protein DVH05_008704 [Phytophthora capsici]